MHLEGLDLRLDPWGVDYGTEVALTDAGTPADAVDLDVEVPVGMWRPVRPAAGAELAPRMAFIDGVRRVEARVMARDGDVLRHGAFGTFAVGSVLVDERGARWGTGQVERVLALSGGLSLADAVPIAPGAVYRPVSTAKTDPDAPLHRLQVEMRNAESLLAGAISSDGRTLVVADGPLRFDDAGGAAVGYVKRLIERHGAPLAALAALEPGTRSPMIVLSGQAGFTRFSWFVRLAGRGPADLDLAGIVRLEVSDAVGFDGARKLADGSAAHLPRFAPTRSRDPRAPQNLLPIGALEARLRRLMGDPLLARRRIQSHLARPEVLHA